MFNPFSLEGKKILITGASSGIGRQCAIDCSKMGAQVALVARNEDRLNETLSMMEGDGHCSFVCDLSRNELIVDLVSIIVEKVGKLDGLIYAAGIEITKPAKITSIIEYSSILNINTISCIELIKQIGGIKYSNKGASFICISSILSVIARSGLSAYAASKGAIVSASRVLAIELSKRLIRVNCISPGTILTPMMQKVLSDMTEEDKCNRLSGFLLGLGATTDISNACLYLLSDASKWVTGQNLIVDGGYTVK